MKYCNQCGEKVEQAIPDNDNRLRFVCVSCETIHYQNPNIVAGTLPLIMGDDGREKVLLCKRAIEPRYGLWTLPAGFMENGETVEEAALRESQEEANVELDDLRLYSVMSMPQINQVYMIFKGDIVGDSFSPGIESLETALFDEEDIPWSEMAFNVITQTLQCYFADRKKEHRSKLTDYKVHNLVYQVPEKYIK
ncbi:NUDIX hydrolase [uncultured Cocleimonas sp.]|uniref:NUDIX hydrolase n=1 Tax=uncultured Cocleimonas sp. TaxID=1051587 RepID=UPI002626DA99|nr:NUDIX hydrolase [uncultured Cocleimonas sp.]